MIDVDSEKIGRIIGLMDHDASGNDCWFIDLKNGWGVKAYFDVDKELRDIAYTCQREAAKRGWAPKAAKKFTVIDEVNGEKWYCYMTEVVECLAGYGFENEHWEDDDYTDEFMDTYDERNEWCDMFYEETGCFFNDSHAGNFGRNKEGKLVLLDWACHSKWYDKLQAEKK